MKLSKLVDKVEKLIRKHEKSGHVKPEKLDKLQQLLTEKKSRYQAKAGCNR